MVSILALAVHFIVDFARGGGGGSGGGGGGHSGGYSSAGVAAGGAGGSGDAGGAIVIFFILIFGILLVAYYMQRRTKKARQLVDASLVAASSLDSAWNKNSLVAAASDVYSRYQSDWSQFNTESMKTYMTPAYLYHNQLMLAALQLAGRQNLVSDVTIQACEVIAVVDAADNNLDSFTAKITSRAKDILINRQTGEQIFANPATATEQYRFVRSGDQWLIDGIDQETADPLTRRADIETFARDNNLCYSLDWGWLLLPSRGQLFGKARFGTSDINNHVIGVYQNMIIQLYTYIPRPSGDGAMPGYVIAQVNLPKSYGNIVVRRKRPLNLLGVRGLTKVSTEWGDFNKKYEVFATNAEQATSFELLNPTYMEQLEATGFEVNIEVVDNVVYLYAPEQVANSATYDSMLQLLQRAFKEMRR